MQNVNSLLNPRRFLSLFCILFLNASNDHLLKNAIVIVLAYHQLKFLGLSSELAINIFTLVFIFPFFLVSSYAGRIADSYNKVTLIKYIKYGEILIVIISALGFYQHNPWLMLLALLAMSIHSTFFGPIKYSILPAYIKERKALLLANGYVELGTFIAVLLGQMLGSWYMGENAINVVIAIMGGSTLLGLILSYCLDANIPVSKPLIGMQWNVIKDIRHTYREVITSYEIKNNIYAISWFWALGVIYTTQLPVFAQQYMGGSAQVFTLLLALFSISIGMGSLFCAKLSNGKIFKINIIIGAGVISILTLLIVILNHKVVLREMSLWEFSHSLLGVINFALIFFIGFFAGFYSVTCYNLLQVIIPQESLSRVVAINNIQNAAFMLVASIICTALLFFISLWWLFVVFIIANTIFILYYWKANF